MGRPSRLSPEVRERAVRLVEEHREEHASEWAVLQSVAPKLGCTAETLRKWVRQAQRDTHVLDEARQSLRHRAALPISAASDRFRRGRCSAAAAILDARGRGPSNRCEPLKPVSDL